MKIKFYLNKEELLKLAKQTIVDMYREDEDDIEIVCHNTEYEYIVEALSPLFVRVEAIHDFSSFRDFIRILDVDSEGNASYVNIEVKLHEIDADEVINTIKSCRRNRQSMMFKYIPSEPLESITYEEFKKKCF